MQLGVHPVAVVGKIVKKKKKGTAIYKRRNNTQHKNIDTQNRKQTHKTTKQAHKQY